MKLWKAFTDSFNCLPVAASVDDKILCMHGGLSPELDKIDQLNKIARPTDVPEQGKQLLQNLGLLCDLLWSDPDKNANGWGPNDRGVSVTFSPSIIETFLKKNDMDLVCRAHQVTIIFFINQFNFR